MVTEYERVDEFSLKTIGIRFDTEFKNYYKQVKEQNGWDGRGGVVGSGGVEEKLREEMWNKELLLTEPSCLKKAYELDKRAGYHNDTELLLDSFVYQRQDFLGL